jgi:pimeloyl-ACP methyl ester carboxylesterase
MALRARSKSRGNTGGRHGWSTGTIRHQHPNTNRVVLLIGGLAKTGYDWRPLLPHLRKKAHVYAEPLARHTGRMWDLRRCRPWNMWKEAERRFLELSAQAGEPIVVGGFSTGALIAYFLYKRYPEKVSALILVGCPTWLQKRWKPPVMLASLAAYYSGFLVGACALFFGSYQLALGAFGISAALFFVTLSAVRAVDGLKKTRLQIVEPRYDRLPLITASWLILMQWHFRSVAEKANVPVLLLHGEKDDLISWSAAAWTAQKLGVEPESFLIVDGSPHAVLIGHQRGRAIEAIVKFFVHLWPEERQVGAA